MRRRMTSTLDFSDAVVVGMLKLRIGDGFDDECPVKCLLTLEINLKTFCEAATSTTWSVRHR